MIRMIVTFRDNCKIQISIATFCLGIGTDQLTPVFKQRVDEKVIQVYGSGNHLFHPIPTINGFSK